MCLTMSEKIKRNRTSKCQKFREYIEKSLRENKPLVKISQDIHCCSYALLSYIRKTGLDSYRKPRRCMREVIEKEKNKIIEYLRTARRFDYACLDLKISAPALRSFIAKNDIEFIPRKGFCVNIPKIIEKNACVKVPKSIRKNAKVIRETEYSLEEKVASMRKQDAEKARHYLTKEDFYQMYDN